MRQFHFLNSSSRRLPARVVVAAVHSVVVPSNCELVKVNCDFCPSSFSRGNGQFFLVGGHGYVAALRPGARSQFGMRQRKGE